MDLTAVLDQEPEQAVLERGAGDLGLVAAVVDAPHLGAVEVDPDVAESVALERCRRRGGRRLGAASPQQRLDPCQEFQRLEGLREVVVGAQLQAEDAVDEFVAGSEHENRRRRAALAQIATDVEAVLARQVDVEQDEVEAAVRGQPLP